AAAIVFGAAAVTFGAGLAHSLDRAFADTSTESSLPVRVSAPPPAIPAGGPSSTGGGKLGRMGMTAAQQRTVISALAAQPGTRRYLPETDEDLSLPRLGGHVSVTPYGGDPRWSGLALVARRLYATCSH